MLPYCFIETNLNFFNLLTNVQIASSAEFEMMGSKGNIEQSRLMEFEGLSLTDGSSLYRRKISSAIIANS